VAKVRKFSTGVDSTKSVLTSLANVVPDLPVPVVDRVAASAPVHIQAPPAPKPTPKVRLRRYVTKTYSMLQEDIDVIESLVADVRSGGLYERGRSDIVRAGVRLLRSLSRDELLQAVASVEDLKDK
jgi:hypothetical protein